MHRKKSHTGVGRWLFRSKDGAAINKESPALVGSSSSSSGPVDDMTMLMVGPDTSFPSAQAAPPIAAAAADGSMSSLNSGNLASARKITAAVAVKESSSRSTSTRETQSMSSNDVSLRSVAAFDDKEGLQKQHDVIGKEGRSLTPKKPKNVSEAVLLMQNFQSAPTTTTFMDHEAEDEDKQEIPPALLDNSMQSLRMSQSSRRIMPDSLGSMPQTRRHERQKSVHVSRTGIDELEARNFKRNDRMKSKSLSKTSREELERLAKTLTLPMIPQAYPSAGTVEREPLNVVGFPKCPAPDRPMRSAIDTDITTSGECSVDGSVKIPKALHEEKVEDDLGKLGMSTVSLVLDDLRIDSQSGLPVSPLSSPFQAPKRNAHRNEDEQEFQRLLADLRDFKALSGSNEFHDDLARGCASTSRFDEYLNSDSYKGQQRHANAHMRANASVSYLNYQNKQQRQVSAAFAHPHSSYHDDSDGDDQEGDDEDIFAQRLLSGTMECRNSLMAASGSSQTNIQLHDASVASLVIEDVFPGTQHKHNCVPSLPLQRPHRSPILRSPHHVITPNGQQLSTAENEVANCHRQSFRSEQLQVTPSSHQSESNDTLALAQEEAMLRLALRRSLNDSRSDLYQSHEVVGSRGSDLQPNTSRQIGLDRNGYIASESYGTSGIQAQPVQQNFEVGASPAPRLRASVQLANQARPLVYANHTAHTLRAADSETLEYDEVDHLLSLDSLNEELSLTQTERDLLRELAREQELHNSLSNHIHLGDEHNHRNHPRHHSTTQLSEMLLPQLIQAKTSSYQGRNSFMMHTDLDENMNDENEAALLAASVMVPHAEQSPPPNNRRVQRVSSTLSQSSQSSRMSFGSHASSRSSFASRGSLASFVSHASASTFDGRQRPVYDWERNLIIRSNDDMDASVDGVEGFYEDSDVYGPDPQVYVHPSHAISASGRQSLTTSGDGHTRSASLEEPQHWARRPPGRARSNNYNEGIEQYWVDNDSEPLSPHLSSISQTSLRSREQDWLIQQSASGRAVTQAEMQHLSLLEQEMMELALQKSMEGEIYESN